MHRCVTNILIKIYICINHFHHSKKFLLVKTRKIILKLMFINFSILDGACLQQLLPRYPNNDFTVPSFLLNLLIGNYPKEELPLPLHLFNYICISVLTQGYFSGSEPYNPTLSFILLLKITPALAIRNSFRVTPCGMPKSFFFPSLLKQL